MPRSISLALLLLLLGCSGAGATVSDSADLTSADRPPVEPEKPVEPVDPSTRFECKTSEPLSDGAVHTITFAMHGDSLEPGIAIEPRADELAPLENATLERSPNKLTLRADARTELTLFENSDYTRGYLKAERGEYSDVYCSKSR